MELFCWMVLVEGCYESRPDPGVLGTVVMIHANDEGYEVEFMTLDGETIAVTSLLATQVRPISHKEIAHVRLVAA